MENENKTFIVTVEGLKRAQIEIEATDFNDAKTKAEARLADTGVDGIEFDAMWDSIKITAATIKPDESATSTGSQA